MTKKYKFSTKFTNTNFSQKQLRGNGFIVNTNINRQLVSKNDGLNNSKYSLDQVCKSHSDNAKMEEKNDRYMFILSVSSIWFSLLCG